MSSGGFSGVLEMFEEVNRGVKFIINDPARKKFEKTLKKIWKGRKKRFIFASAFATRNGDGLNDKRRVL